MKLKYIISSALIILSLASCNKKEEDYQAKNVKVESVFDKVENTPKDAPKDDNNPNPDENAGENQANPNGENQNNPNEDKKAEEANNKKKYKTRDITNMRSNPNTEEDNVLVAVPGGREFEAIEETNAEDGAWIKLNFEGNTGFIRKDLLDEIN